MSPSSRGARRRRAVAAGGLFLLLIASVLASLAFGSRSIPFGEVFEAVFSSVDSDNATVITSQRGPRTILGLLAGAALGMAGALMQGHTRNPLADPGLFGVNAGATFAVAVLAFGFGHAGPTPTVVAALVGAGTVATIITMLGLRGMRGGAIVMLAILGTTMAALLSALTTALVLLDKQTLNVLRFWEVGALHGRDNSAAPALVALMATGAVLALVNARSLDSLGLGEDVARSLGTRVVRARIAGIAAITLLAGAATAWCGPLVFVGLVAPHAARALSGHDYRWIVPLSALAGAAVLLAADTVGRVVAPPGELQAGLMIAVFGAPVLLSVTRRRRMVAL